MKGVTPADVGAIIIIIATAVLIGLGIDSEVKSILAMAAGWAFGRATGVIRPYGG